LKPIRPYRSKLGDPEQHKSGNPLYASDYDFEGFYIHKGYLPFQVWKLVPHNDPNINLDLFSYLLLDHTGRHQVSANYLTDEEFLQLAYDNWGTRGSFPYPQATWSIIKEYLSPEDVETIRALRVLNEL